MRPGEAITYSHLRLMSMLESEYLNQNRNR